MDSENTLGSRETQNGEENLREMPSKIYHSIDHGTVVEMINDYEATSAVVPVADRIGIPSSKHRIGTKSFMAQSLHDTHPTRHGYRHDLESLLYCLYWIILEDVTYYDHGIKEWISRHPFYEWHIKSTLEVGRKKAQFWNRLSYAPLEDYTQIFDRASELYCVFVKAFAAESSASLREVILRRSYPTVRSTFDFETAGGLLSFEKLTPLVLES